MTSQWLRWRLKSPASRLFTQSLIQAQIKKNIKAPRHWPFCGELTGDRWIPRIRAGNAENVSIWWRHHFGDQLANYHTNTFMFCIRFIMLILINMHHHHHHHHHHKIMNIFILFQIGKEYSLPQRRQGHPILHSQYYGYWWPGDVNGLKYQQAKVDPVCS